MVFSDSYKKELFSRILSDIAKIYNSTPSRIIEKFLEKELLAEDKNLSEIAEKLYADEKAKCKTALRILINRAARDPSNISKECFVEMIDTTKIGFDYNGDYIDNGTAEEKEALSYELNNLLAFSKELKNIKRLPFEMRHSFFESLNYLEDNIIHDSKPGTAVVLSYYLKILKRWATLYYQEPFSYRLLSAIIDYSPDWAEDPSIEKPMLRIAINNIVRLMSFTPSEPTTVLDDGMRKITIKNGKLIIPKDFVILNPDDALSSDNAYHVTARLTEYELAKYGGIPNMVFLSSEKDSDILEKNAFKRASEAWGPFKNILDSGIPVGAFKIRDEDDETALKDGLHLYNCRVERFE